MENQLLKLTDEVTFPGGGEPMVKPAPVEVKMRPGQEEQEKKTNDGIMLGGRPITVNDECDPEHPMSPIGTTTTAMYDEEGTVAPRTGNMAPDSIK